MLGADEVSAVGDSRNINSLTVYRTVIIPVCFTGLEAGM